MVKHGEKNKVDLQGGSSQLYLWLTGAKHKEFSGIIYFITSNNHPSNPQQPIHSLQNTSKLNMVKKNTTTSWWCDYNGTPFSCY